MMTNTPVVTVVMPVYNRQQYLAEAIESVLAQTVSNWQLLLVDDGSTDRSVEICQHYVRLDDRITLLQQSHEGCYRARNLALAHTDSPFTVVFDSDDVATPDRFEKQLAFLQEHTDHVAAGSWIVLTDPFGVPNRVVELPADHQTIDAQHIRGMPGAMAHPATIVRTDALRKLGGYRLAPCSADHDLFLRLAEIGKVANLPEPLQHVRRHFQSISGSSRGEQIDIARQFTQEARARRGLPPLPESDQAARAQRDANVMSIAEQARSWTLHAIHQGRLGIARRHAWTVLRNQPWHLESWRLLRWAIRG